MASPLWLSHSPDLVNRYAAPTTPAVSERKTLAPNVRDWASPKDSRSRALKPPSGPTMSNTDPEATPEYLSPLASTSTITWSYVENRFANSEDVIGSWISGVQDLRDCSVAARVMLVHLVNCLASLSPCHLTTLWSAIHGISPVTPTWVSMSSEFSSRSPLMSAWATSMRRLGSASTAIFLTTNSPAVFKFPVMRFP